MVGLVGLVAAAVAAPPSAVGWVAEVQLGADPAGVAEVLRRSGATRVEPFGYRQPGAFARGLLDAPGLLAALHRAGAAPALFDGLPEAGPSFVVGEGPDGRAAYVFVDERLVAFAVTFPARSVAPHDDPFRRDRLAPLRATVDALCWGVRPAERDDYGNVVGWLGERCSGGTLVVRYEPLEPEAALQAVVFRR